MSRHVTVENATVYRCNATRRRYLSRWPAYYNAAKALVRERYPDPDYAVGYESETNSTITAEEDDLDRDWDRIRERRARLFFDEGGDGGCMDPGWEPCFDTERWQAFIRRLAKFLRFVDKGES